MFFTVPTGVDSIVYFSAKNIRYIIFSGRIFLVLFIFGPKIIRYIISRACKKYV